MPLDIFMTIDSKKGESADKQFAGSFEVLSFAWGETNTFDPKSGNVGKPSFDSVSVVVQSQTSTTDFFYDLAVGTPYKSVTISVRNGGGRVVQKYLLEDARVVEFRGGVGAGEDRPLDSLKFGFTKITYSYWPVLKDGTLGKEQKRTYDLKSGKGG